MQTKNNNSLKHKYPTKFQEKALLQNHLSRQYEILYFGSQTKVMEWMFPKQRKEIQSYLFFKITVKSKLIKTENETSFCFL